MESLIISTKADLIITLRKAGYELCAAIERIEMLLKWTKEKDKKYGSIFFGFR